MTDALLRNILGVGFDQMPDAVRRMHSIERTQDVCGISRVMGGKNPVSRFIRVIALLPRPAHRASIHIHFIKGHNLEEWDRYFGKSRFHTVMKQEGPYLSEQLVRFPVTFVYEVRANERGFSLHVAQVRFLGVRLPRLFRPTLKARASEWRGQYRFSTLVGFWFCGRVISYLGYLEAPRDAATENASITIVYDGMCNLCSASVTWIAKRVDRRVQFAPAQSEVGREALKAAGLDALDPESFLVVENGRVLQKSAAVIAVLNIVGGGWKMTARLLGLLPQSAGDGIYAWVAAHRYKWFGRRDTCFFSPARDH
jgi:predicted DCC family thiol-disulfide oxidoreductase YuxK